MHFGRPAEKNFIVTGASPKSMTKIKDKIKQVSFQALEEISPNKYGQPQAVTRTPERRFFTQIVNGSSLGLWMEKSPEKKKTLDIGNSGEQRFEGIPPLEEIRKDTSLMQTCKTETFDFQISPETIESRVGQKRPISQQAVMGSSAADLFKELGAKIKKTEARYFHHAHRQAWSLGGSQTEENMDLGTAGSNINTLLTIEEPLKELLKRDLAESIAVEGLVLFHPLLDTVPMEISYCLKWGNNREATIKTYPLEHRFPTMAEKEAVTAVLEVIKSPPRPIRFFKRARQGEDGYIPISLQFSDSECDSSESDSNESYGI